MIQSGVTLFTLPRLTAFTRDRLDDGIDPILPLIKTGEKESVIDGVALFKEDRYITKINPEDTLTFSVLYSNFRTG
ncbi:hypothetical protein [Paraliobacillus sediminis]|uniref:hypothetical protein n=1 Tax=Paraliobacillus sediminis TaxID=1885916 RepID=UPI0013C3000C|nr:hypothetical protein [Paraliobacillus sediminis]